MLLAEDKILLANTLNHCWFLNLNHQMKCQEIFQAFNRIWNSLDNRVTDRQEINDDSVKFRRLIQTVILPENVGGIIGNSSFTKLSQINPLIHNDHRIGMEIGAPYLPGTSQSISSNAQVDATLEHREFIKYLARVRENANSKNVREFRNKLVRLLYVVRSNIAHGSKINYQGSERNEEVCSVIYEILIQISNIILDNGFYKICAYGELKRDGRLFEPMVTNNGGRYLHDASIEGQFQQIDNTSYYNYSAEYSQTEVEIIEFEELERLVSIDLVECMPRHFKPYYVDNILQGFGWVYYSFKNIQDINGPVTTFDRHKRTTDKAIAFFYALSGIEKKLKLKNVYSNSFITKMYGGLLIKTDDLVSFEKGNSESVFSFPYAIELVSVIDEIDQNFRAVYDFDGDILPYSQKVSQAIGQVKFDRPHFFESGSIALNDNELSFILIDIVELVCACVAGWLSDQINDSDLEIWDGIQKLNTSSVN